MNEKKKIEIDKLLSSKVLDLLQEIDKLSSIMDDKSIDKLENILKKVKSYQEESLKTTLNQENETFMNFKSKGLSQIEIVKYKKIENLKIENLNRINIFAGVNNAGKTSLLEAISLLLNQNDIYHFLDIQRRRAKLIKLNSLWLNNEFLKDIELRGVFNYVPLVVEIQKQNEKSETLNKEGYLSSIDIKSSFGDENLSSSVRLFEEKNEKHYKSIKIVCNNSYSSPFSIQNKDDLEKHYARAVQKDILIDILDFIKEHIDPKLKDIRFTKEYIETFKVNHKDFTIDLSAFGEGLQRVFYIALQFASAQNGVILIDELENGLHYTLLESFTKFMQELAVKLNVQLFLTTHSKETIEAFVSNGFENEDISYNLMVENRRENRVKVIHYNSDLLIKELEEHQEVRGW
ncbi:hypothetical protein MNB_SV-9-284 [hydrothermal vent metagenome]|uniref:AAA+ ATPase domain-containing protein n=1 Tax=hydrothermal vent metagenome TaxID=652676 RepID=A0A1W1BAK4_9ZZZZ